jgi:hypothetical protein
VTNGAPCPIDSADELCPGNFVGAFDTTLSGGASLIYLEYVALTPTGLATDGLGNAYVYGEVEPLSTPTYAVPNGYQTVSDGGGSNTLLQKFNLSGTITYGTFFQATTAGAVSMHAAGVAADASGRAFITGYGNSPGGNQNLPNLNGLPVPTALNCCSYVYLGAIDTTKSGTASLLYGTKMLPSTLPASLEIDAAAFSVATDGAGKVLLAAQVGSSVQPSGSASPLYPIVNPLSNAAPGLQTAALSLIDTTQSGTASLVFSSPINGSGNQPMQVFIDAADNLYLAGSTVYSTASSPSLPTTSNGYEPQVASGDLAPYLLKISLGTSAAPTVTLAATPTTLTLGQSSMLTWSSGNATACTASGGWSGSESLSGTQSVTPAAVGTATYTLSCSGAGGTVNALAAITVNAVVVPTPTVTLTASPTTITLGQSTTLTWSSTNATSCTASNAWSGAQATSGTQHVSPTQIGTNTYTLTCNGPGGSLVASAAVTVNNPPPPTVTMSVAPTSITLGQSATLTWSSTNATTCTASNAWSGAENTNGTLAVTPGATGTQTYTLTCSAAGSTSTVADVTLTVNAPAAASGSGHSGGGSLGIGSLLGLAFLLAWRSGRK